MAVNNNFPVVPENENQAGWVSLLKRAVNSAIRGKLNCTGEVTLTANAASTAVTNNRCTAGSVALIIPKTANAAAALATTYIATYAEGSFTITHANNAQTDKEFKYVILG